MDFGFSTTDEICAELGHRLKAARLAQGLLQSDLAARAGVARGTLATLENSGQGSLASIVQVAQALGLTGDLQDVFAARVRSIAQMERSAPGQRKRASRKRQGAVGGK